MGRKKTLACINITDDNLRNSLVLVMELSPEWPKVFCLLATVEKKTREEKKSADAARWMALVSSSLITHENVVFGRWVFRIRQHSTHTEQ